jgi:hypothetical protein
VLLQFVHFVEKNSVVDDFASKEDGETSPNFDAKDPMNKALSKYISKINK